MAAVALAILLSACGGGGGGGSSSNSSTNTNTNPNTNTSPSVTSVKVVGASLADSGTFGFKFTVQPKETYKVYSELVASAYRISSICPAYSYTGSFTTNSGCTNYAVAGAKVNNYDATYSAVVESVPLSLVKQLQDVGNGGFSANDLLIVGEASSNDAAALTAGYIEEHVKFNGAEFSDTLATLLTLTQMTDNAGDPSTLGVLYMQALADKLVVAVKTNALDKGAKRVAIVNTLDVTRTPRFVATLAFIENATDAATANSLATMVKGWIQAYNARLLANVAAFGGDVIVVDLYTAFNARLDSYASYGLSNISATVCDKIVTGGTAPGTTALGVDSAGQAVVAACTGTAPTAPADWQSYMFADSFHPTPFGHQILSGIVVDRLTAARWM
jgi:phospholipase/lecithinase/hemolysin